MRIRFPIVLLATLLWATATHAQAPTDPNEAYAQVGGRVLRMDVYRANAAGPRPVVVWLHDGGWLTGDRTLPAFVAPLLERGVSIASIDYRLTSEAGQYGAEGVTFPAQIHDVKAAIRFLRAHGADFDLDTTRIGAWGSSAGGHLAALAGTSAGVASLEGELDHLEYSSRVQAVVDYYGPTDLLQLIPDVTTPPGSIVEHDAPTGPGSLLIGFSATGQGLGVLRANAANPNRPFPTFRALAQAANPIAFVDAGDPPFLIAHGTADNQVAIRQSERLRDALAGAGVPVELVRVQGAAHGGFPDSVHAQARDFLVARLTSPTIAITNPLALTGLWYETTTSGQGIEVQWLAGDLMVVFFYGHRDNGANLFLIGTRVGRPSYGELLRMDMTTATNGRWTNFDASAIQRTTWGTLELRFADCDHATATLAGADGNKAMTLVPLARAATATRCD
ncbi:MAG TPA: alpha/beta hydrolase [Xanthomonadales bacterium]|nr:alpha/beta hydrolase [Xanthomonadales bacterium]